MPIAAGALRPGRIALVPHRIAPEPSVTPPEPLCLAIFDHDGVLVDSLANHTAAWVEMGRREGLPATAEFVQRTFGKTNSDIFFELLGERLNPIELARLEAIKEGCYREIAAGNLELMDGVRGLLDALTSSGVLLAIGSSSVLPNLLLTIESCGLPGRFAAIASGEEVSKGKPDPEIFLLAATKLGVSPSRSVVFEDAPSASAPPRPPGCGPSASPRRTPPTPSVPPERMRFMGPSPGIP